MSHVTSFSLEVGTDTVKFGICDLVIVLDNSLSLFLCEKIAAVTVHHYRGVDSKNPI